MKSEKGGNNVTTALCILSYIAIGVVVAILFSWKEITRDVTSMLIVTYLWPVFILWIIVDNVFIRMPMKFYRKFNRYLRKKKHS